MSGVEAYVQAVWLAYFGVAMWRHDPLNASIAGMAIVFMLFSLVERQRKNEGGA